MGEGDHGIGILLIIWGIAAYGALEFVIQSRGIYQAGVDDALLWLAGGLLFGGINLLDNNFSATLKEAMIILVLARMGPGPLCRPAHGARSLRRPDLPDLSFDHHHRRRRKQHSCYHDPLRHRLSSPHAFGHRRIPAALSCVFVPAADGRAANVLSFG